MEAFKVRMVTMKDFKNRQKGVIEDLKLEEKWETFLKKFVEELGLRYKSWDEISATEVFQDLQSDFGVV